MDEPLEEGAGSRYYRGCPELFTGREPHALDAKEAFRLWRGYERIDRALPQVEPGGMLQDFFHPGPVKGPVSLRARCPYGRALAVVQGPHLYGGLVDGPGHLSAERVYLLDEVSLGYPADGRVAGHLADGVEVQCNDEGRKPRARRREGCFAPGVSRADDYYVVLTVMQSLPHLKLSSNLYSILRIKKVSTCFNIYMNPGF